MNLRFAAHSLRIRISADEFARLTSGEPQRLEVSLPRGHVFQARVDSGNDWLFDSNSGAVQLTVPHSELTVLAQALPSRSGLEHGFATQNGELRVSLEVDVKAGRSRQA